jgi:murein DD-endopeptidase MepM/ murein hydrolase activator NlpD
MRFTDAPFSSPFKTAQSGPARDPATTGSIGRPAGAGFGDGAPLSSAPAAASVRSQPLPPPQSAVALRSAAPVAMAGSASGWSATGGTPIVVAQGETLDMISSRYGVPKAALISSNGLSSPSIAPGSRLTIPVYNAAGASAPAAPRQMAQSAQVQSDARPQPAPRALPTAAARTAPVPAVDARAAAAADARAKAAADAQAMRESRARFAAEAKAKAEARKTATATAPVAAAAPAPKVAEVRKPAPPAARPVVVASAPAEPKAAPVPKTVVAEPKVEAKPDPKTTGSVPKQEEAAPAAEKADFRWPARGRVIAGFSGKGGNEGINIAVPEGTPIKAAEGGTVAYAGNELKGYGNLVLIRHPNGYVSAYAHNGALNVKRGDTIKRGQVVATAGQTGNVSSPQLHFELRKGSTPVDPTPYLNN